MAARAIAMRSGKGDPGRHGRSWKIAYFRSALIEEIDDDRFHLRHGEAELVGPGKAQHSLKHGDRGGEGGLRRRDRIGGAGRFRFVGQERMMARASTNISFPTVRHRLGAEGAVSQQHRA